MSIIHQFKNDIDSLFLSNFCILKIMTILRIPSFLNIYFPASCFFFFLRNIPASCLSLESSPMKVVAFFIDDDSMLTTQPQDLICREKDCQIVFPFTFSLMPNYFSTHMHAYPKTSYLKSKILFEGKKII